MSCVKACPAWHYFVGSRCGAMGRDFKRGCLLVSLKQMVRRQTLLFHFLASLCPSGQAVAPDCAPLMVSYFQCKKMSHEPQATTFKMVPKSHAFLFVKLTVSGICCTTRKHANTLSVEQNYAQDQRYFSHQQ